MKHLWLLALSLLLISECRCGDSKYSIKKQKTPFRMQKHNKLWNQAVKNFQASPKLADLHRELSKLDRLAMKLKHIDPNDANYDDKLAKQVKQLYLDISDRYGLATNNVDIQGHNEIKPKFTDKIENLWQEAVYSGKFDQDELTTLEQELKHHEKRIEDYRGLADKITEHDEISDNDIRILDKPPETELKKMRTELKAKHHNLSTNFLDLEKKVKERVADVTGDFTDSRVSELWHQAQYSGFSKQELDSIKEELRHFQIRIDKHKYWQDRHAKMKNDMNEGHLLEPSEQDKISEKVAEHRRFVKKYHATMMERIHRKEEL